ncbi:MAG: hypothetical protein IKU55_04960 [Clostridia bacterium]|nr:hypothetical protein [Clostridia bacterium]
MGKYSENTYIDLETGVESNQNPKAIALGYIDPNGVSRTGYSIDNRMYKDAAGTERIDNGSIVTSRDGSKSWIQTDAGGVDYAEYQREQAAMAQPTAQLQAAKSAALTAAEQRTQAEITAIEAERPQIHQAYDDLSLQNYQGYRQSQAALANSLASQGLYNSGYSDTAKVAQDTSYRAVQNATERERLQRLSELDNQIRIARLNGSAERSELEAQYAQLLNEQANADRAYLYQEQRDRLEDTRWQSQWDLTQAQWEHQLNEDAQAQKNWQAEYNAAQARLAWEQEKYREQTQNEQTQRAIDNAYAAAAIGDFRQLKALGIDTSRAEEAYWLEQQSLYYDVDEYGDLAEERMLLPYRSLRENDPDTYDTVLSYAYSFAENMYRVEETERTMYFRNMTELVKKTYGQDYASMYRDVINYCFSLQENRTESSVSLFDLDEFLEQAQKFIFGNVVETNDDGLGYTERISSYTVVDPEAQKKYFRELLSVYNDPNSRMNMAEFLRACRTLGYTETEVRALLSSTEPEKAEE